MPKNKTNGFMCFVMDWKTKNGKKNLNVPQAIAEANPLWQKMSAQERAPFNDRAKRERVDSKPQEKLDCLGRPLTHVDMEREELQQQERLMKRTIENTVKSSIKMNALTTQKYFFIMVNYFSKSTDGVHVPAELAVAQFSLKEGVHRKYHTLIKPDTEMFGYKYEANAHANETHLLPLPPQALGASDLGNVYNDVISFVRDSVTGDLPPVYTHRDHMAAVKSVLNYLQTDVQAGDEVLKVYSIQHLFFTLKDACAEIGEVTKPSSIFVTDAQFERDHFEYEIGISCAFHEEKDRTKHCALSYVTRWGFLFGDYMCNDIAIIPKPGCHIPIKTCLNAITVMPEDSKKKIPNVTETKADIYWEKRWANETNTNSSYSDFPALGARKKTTPSVVSSYTPSQSFKKVDREPISDDDMDDTNNPWKARSLRNKPPAADSTLFEIDFSSVRTLQTTLDDESISLASLGRGRGVSTPKPPSRLGQGRGQLFDL